MKTLESINLNESEQGLISSILNYLGSYGLPPALPETLKWFSVDYVNELVTNNNNFLNENLTESAKEILESIKIKLNEK